MSEKETARKVMPGRVKIADTARNFWAITVEQGTTREELKRPEFWSLVGKQFKPYDRLEVRCDDGSYFAEYLVLSAARTWAKVHELRFEALGTQDVSMTEAEEMEFRSRFAVAYRGPHLLHCVERKEGDRVDRLAEKLQTKVEAMTWLENYLKNARIPA